MPRVRKERLFKTCFPPNMKTGQEIWVSHLGIRGTVYSNWISAVVVSTGIDRAGPYGIVRLKSGTKWYFDDSTWNFSNRHSIISLTKPSWVGGDDAKGEER